MSTGRRIFLTGATGFIGRRLAAALAARGDRLFCLVRDTSRARALEELGATLVHGDVSDDVAIRRGMKDAELAYHVAGIYDTGVVDEGALERVNVDGTRVFLQHARYAEVSRLIHVSTAVALGPTDAEEAEDRDWSGPYPTIYHRTKTEAHRLAKDAQRLGMPLAIACPTFVYGPGDEGPAGRFIRDVARRRLPGLISNPALFSYAYVDDVVGGLVAMGDHGGNGGIYVLGGERMTVNEFAAAVARHAGVKPPPLELPPAVVRTTGRALDVVSRLTRRRFTISRENVDAACCRPWAPGWSRAARDLGYPARAVDEGLPATLAASG